MNLYIVVEGDRSESEIYPHWIKHINPVLKQVFQLSDIATDTYFLVSGHGYPSYLSVVKNAVEDINEKQGFDRLVVAIDSEDASVAEKSQEVQDCIDSIGTALDCRIIVQQKCFESWCLANKKLIQRNPQNLLLREYIAHYNVVERDPALMPSISPDLTSSQFAFKYLSLAMQEKGIYYSKRNPRYVADSRFFYHLNQRAINTNHIATLNDFRLAFSN